jgi:hypothetical protein
VFSSIILIGLIGLATDIFLARLGKSLFPWAKDSRRGVLSSVVAALRGKREPDAASAANEDAAHA